MANLHLVRTSGFQSDRLSLCLSLLNNDDRVLLLDDGVYNVNHPSLLTLSNTILYLDLHASARGINPAKLFKAVDYKSLIEETEQAEKIITWQ
ncbi:sulfurtransferase complex subunit TusB [Thalassotalea aquiviva]|uniref:sulfurtransferase complex subunit TusB n=1 Tax=Thalassotalea aquiviva TaxID=3242415 RepID=UPI00352A684D